MPAQTRLPSAPVDAFPGSLSPGLVVLFALWLTIFGLALPADAASAPNLLFIMADDLDHADLYGGLTTFGGPDTITTPNLDAVQQEGLFFTQYYTNGAVCSPTRASILSGDHQHGFGLKHLVNAPPFRGLPAGLDTLPEVLAASPASYWTLHVGKWHLGKQRPEYLPAGVGFDRWAYHGGGAKNLFYHWNLTRDDGVVEQQCPEWVSGCSTPISQMVHLTDRLTQQAITFVDDWLAGQGDPAAAEHDRPFFLNLWYLAPHKDWLPPPELCPACPPPSVTQAPCACTALDDRDRYELLVQWLDTKLGDLLTYLEQTPDPRQPGSTLADTTLVVFTSDNGGKNTVHQPADVPHRPLIGYKHELLEGGIRVPMLVRWRQQGDWQGQANSSIGASMDWLPTFADLAGVDPATLPGDGESFADLLCPPATAGCDPTEKRIRVANQSSLIWEAPSGTRAASPAGDDYSAYAVRRNGWKLISHIFTGNQNKETRLFNLVSDPDEDDDCQVVGDESDPGEADCTDTSKLASLESIYQTWRFDQRFTYSETVVGTPTLTGDVYQLGATDRVDIDFESRLDHHDGELGFVTDITPGDLSGTGERIVALRSGSWRLFVNSGTDRIYLDVLPQQQLSSGPPVCDSGDRIRLVGPKLVEGTTYRVAVAIQGVNNEIPDPQPPAAQNDDDNAIRLYVSGPGIGDTLAVWRHDDWSGSSPTPLGTVAVCPTDQPILLGNSAVLNHGFVGGVRRPTVSTLAPTAAEVTTW